MEPAAYLEHLRSDGSVLARAARTAPSAPIPSCPEWDMTGLLAHVGGVHRWVDHIVATRSESFVKRQSSPPEGWAATLDWYQAGLAQLVATLSAIDPDQAVWNWADQAPAPARFWFRRMAHETAIHRWDGEAGAAGAAAVAGAIGAGHPHPIAADLAVDGIDEYLSFVGMWLARQPVAGLDGSLHLHATDSDSDSGSGSTTGSGSATGSGTGSARGEWSLDLWPDRVEYRREHAKADAALRGPVSDLLLWMVNRLPADSPRLQVFGDRAIIDRWRQLQF